MKILNTAYVQKDFPDDTVWDGDDVVQSGGRNIAEALSEALEQAGYTPGEMEDGLDDGWEFFATKLKKKFWIRVHQWGDPDCYIFTKFFGGFGFLKSNKQAHRELISVIDSWLRGDPRFHDVKWQNPGD